MEKRLSPDHLVHAGTRNSKSKTLPLGMGYVLEGRCSGLYTLQPKVTHLEWSQAPLHRCPEKAVVPTCLLQGQLQWGPRLLPHFCFARDGDEQNQTGTLLCGSCRGGRRGWSLTLTKNPERCISHTILALFSQLALILSFARAETTWVFYILHCFQEICSLVVGVSKSTSK